MLTHLQNKDCTLSEDGNDHYFQGPVDVEKFQALPNITCHSYMCGTVEDMAAVTSNIGASFTASESGH